jgi:ubiquinone/menaquinone biosynthesis C-methylase UbiE
MPVESKVESYFSSAASGYHTASSGRLWGIVRQREARALLAVLGPVDGQDVLELGCGASFYTRLLLAHGAKTVHAVDLSIAMLAQLPKSQVVGIRADATTLNPGRKFDVVIAAGMLEFVPDPAAVLRNAALYAMPGARFAVLFPTKSILGRIYRGFHYRNGLSIALFDCERIRTMAADSEWRLQQFQPAGPYSAAALLVTDSRP